MRAPGTADGKRFRPELERCLAERGYTPPVRALPELLAALQELDDAERERLERAIARAGAPAVEQALLALSGAAAPQRPLLLALLARLASQISDAALAARLRSG